MAIDVAGRRSATTRSTTRGGDGPRLLGEPAAAFVDGGAGTTSIEVRNGRQRLAPGAAAAATACSAEVLDFLDLALRARGLRPRRLRGPGPAVTGGGRSGAAPRPDLGARGPPHPAGRAVPDPPLPRADHRGLRHGRPRATSASIRSASPWTSSPAPAAPGPTSPRLARWAEPRQNRPRVAVPLGRLERRLQPRPPVRSASRAAAARRTCTSPGPTRPRRRAASARTRAGLRGALNPGGQTPRAVRVRGRARPRTHRRRPRRAPARRRQARARAGDLAGRERRSRGLGARPRGLSAHGRASSSASPARREWGSPR